ncbi:MAG TPA: hypothetical protein VLF42_13720, partial [Burkholderiales bacterium]|nr:hypothetical protein [Burkholderiales bacterium]
DAVACTVQELIPVCIEMLTAAVHVPIDFDDEARFAAREVSDVAADDDLLLARPVVDPSSRLA